MIEINIVPHDGVIIKDVNKICFGQTLEEVKERLGEPTREYISYYHNNLLNFYNPAYVQYLPIDAVYANNIQYFYDDFEIRVDFDSDKKVEFIECIAGPCPDKTKPFIYGKEAFKLLAEELIELLTEKNNGVIDIESPKRIYSFLEIDVGIFREMSESDAKEIIKEAELDGTYEINKESHVSDLKKAYHFWTIGVGCGGYYRKYRRI